MHEWKSLGTGHSETVKPVDGFTSLIALSDTRKMWLLTHWRPWLCQGVTVTGMSTSKWPLSRPHTRTDPLKVAVAIRSPSCEYLAAITNCWWWSVCIFSPLATSQIVAVQFEDPETSSVESGEKSISALMSKSTLSFQTLSCVSASHTNTMPHNVPPRDPFPVLRHGETVDILRFDRCHSLAVLHSPHLNVLVLTTAQQMLAIRRKFHRTYVPTGVDFDGLGTFFSNCQYQCSPLFSIRTRNCRRHG